MSRRGVEHLEAKQRFCRSCTDVLWSCAIRTLLARSIDCDVNAKRRTTAKRVGDRASSVFGCPLPAFEIILEILQSFRQLVEPGANRSHWEEKILSQQVSSRRPKLTMPSSGW